MASQPQSDGIPADSAPRRSSVASIAKYAAAILVMCGMIAYGSISQSAQTVSVQETQNTNTAAGAVHNEVAFEDMEDPILRTVKSIRANRRLAAEQAWFEDEEQMVEQTHARRLKGSKSAYYSKSKSAKSKSKSKGALGRSIEDTFSPFPTQTPFPTATPFPTGTPFPTITPLPTFTPVPTFTPFPTITKDPSLGGATTAPTVKGATTAPTVKGATIAPTVKGATTAPTMKGATSAPTKKGATTAPTTKMGTAGPTKAGGTTTTAPTTKATTR